MKKPLIIITGCGYKPINYIYKFKQKPTHTPIFIEKKEYKMNIGTATAYYLCKKHFEVLLVSRDKEKLKKIKEGLKNLGCKENLIFYVATDLTTKKGIKKLIKNIPKNKQIYVVQSIGMGGGSYKIPHDNIYLPFEEISPEIIKIESGIVPATHLLLLELIKKFKEQRKKGQEVRICIITSMSGERGYHFGATHVAAKHALVGWIKGVKNELKDLGIKIIDIRPGAIDTGMYDNPYTKKNVEEISKRTKMWKGKKPIFEPPLTIAKVIYHALFNKKPKEVYRILAPNQS